ncbi:hypothetical protein KC19_2G015400 [Ceratodon purpureus]|uniref:TF-B3 domain-containing protein n=1 Tax=Ceratodon purpureus TaxID=3225 RepID=A0A8T0IRP1_CERPU|nr:hypothetical protein KC19_2G015400 [Ceratodon purpureus]
MKKKSCFICLKNCERLHGDEEYDDPEEEITPAGSSGPSRKETAVAEAGGSLGNGAAELHPAFLKKMTELSITSALQMPASFVRSFGTRMGTTVTLQGPGNQKWEVQIGNGTEKNSMEFRDGWLKFVADHILQIGDQLTFSLIAKSHFQVVVFDQSGSQKISASDAVNSPPRLQQSKVVEVHQGGPSVPFRNKPSARPKQKVRRKIRTDGAVPPMKPDVQAPAVHSSDSELRNSDTPEKVDKAKGAASEEKSDDDGEPDPDDESDLPLLPPHTIVEGHVISQRRPVTQAERDRTLLAAKAFPATNPKLVVVMTRGYVYRGFWLVLSRPFAKKHMPTETREVTMQNMAGHSWIVKWLHKEAGSGGFSAGWRGFALDHRLEEGDVCVFEILDQKHYVLLVHIFRVVGGPKEDTRDYCPTPGRGRNADWIQTPTGFKRRLEADSSRQHPAGPSSPMKSLNSPTPGKYKAPVRCSKIEDPDYTLTPQKVQMPSSSKRGPKPAAKVGHGVRSPDFVPDESLEDCQKAKKVKISPTTSFEAPAEYASFATPRPGDLEKVGLDLNVRPLLTKHIATDTSDDELLKRGKELVKATKSASPSSSSSDSEPGGEEMQTVPPINGIATRQEDLCLPETCVCED